MCLHDACSSDSRLDFEKLCGIHYLAAILELPKFWRLKTENGIDTGKRHLDFLSRLCETIFQLMQDTELEFANDCGGYSPPLWTSARHAVDILALATFDGFLRLHDLYKEHSPCPPQLSRIVSFLIRCVTWL